MATVAGARWGQATRARRAPPPLLRPGELGPASVLGESRVQADQLRASLTCRAISPASDQGSCRGRRPRCRPCLCAGTGALGRPCDRSLVGWIHGECRDRAEDSAAGRDEADHPVVVVLAAPGWARAARRTRLAGRHGHAVDRPDGTKRFLQVDEVQILAEDASLKPSSGWAELMSPRRDISSTLSVPHANFVQAAEHPSSGPALLACRNWRGGPNAFGCSLDAVVVLAPAAGRDRRLVSTTKVRSSD